MINLGDILSAPVPVPFGLILLILILTAVDTWLSTKRRRLLRQRDLAVVEFIKTVDAIHQHREKSNGNV